MTFLYPYKNKPRHRFITQEGYPFILIAMCLCILTIIFKLTILAFLLFLLTLFIVFFFRNPKRTFNTSEDILLASADGKIIAIEELSTTEHIKEPCVKISTFMSVFNCHVNRVPVDGQVEKIIYNPGKFFVASLDKASILNEQNAIIIKDRKNRKIVVIQIAGLIARRIVTYLKEGSSINQGSRLGLIRFGSRVDLIVPAGILDIKVKKGDRVYAGKTIIGRWL